MHIIKRGPVRWVEVSTHCERKRMEALSKVLNEQGLENEVAFMEAEISNASSVISEACSSFEQIRLGGSFGELAMLGLDRQPASIIAVRSADALVREDGHWWPRCYLSESILQTVATSIQKLDFSGGVFILGAGIEARAMVDALVRVGFSRFTISDPSEEKGQILIEELRASYFRTQFQFVPSNLITQLPGIYSFAVNTLVDGRDDGSIGELFYFNFLKSGGVWLDLPLFSANTALDSEADSVGAFILHGAKVAIKTDEIWVLKCFGVHLDLRRYAEILGVPGFTS